MDGQFGLNLEAVFQHISKSETFSIAFPILRRALVVDMRANGEEGPFIKVMPMARNAADRLRTLKRLRPALPRAAEILVVPWSSFIDGLIRAGIWDKLRERVASSGSRSAIDALEKTLEELRSIESQELGALLTGDRYETIWSRVK